MSRQSMDKNKYSSVSELKGPLRKSELAKTLLIKGENLNDFEIFRSKLLTEMVPQTETENILCEKFISSAWKHRRSLEVEKHMLNKQNEIKDFDYDEASLGKERKRIRNIKKVRYDSEEMKYLLQYQLELEKLMYRCLSRFRYEQSLRAS